MNERIVTSKIKQHIESALKQALDSLTGKRFSASWTDESSGVDNSDTGQLIWQQNFSIGAAPALWIAAGKATWSAIAGFTLENAGVDSPEDNDLRTTWLEILSQTVSGFTASLASDVGREITVAKGSEVKVEPDQARWIRLALRTDGHDGEFRINVGLSPVVLALYEPSHEKPRTEGISDGVGGMSKTFDLLLDVALPVSVSFGKTHLQVREVIKLNTGSIVELDRLVSEPVDVVVNDCVIARGEVVVVDGNYGVRIKQLASREDRLRTGMTDLSGRVVSRP